MKPYQSGFEKQAIHFSKTIYMQKTIAMARSCSIPLSARAIATHARNTLHVHMCASMVMVVMVTMVMVVVMVVMVNVRLEPTPSSITSSTDDLVRRYLRHEIYKKLQMLLLKKFKVQTLL